MSEKTEKKKDPWRTQTLIWTCTGMGLPYPGMPLCGKILVYFAITFGICLNILTAIASTARLVISIDDGLIMLALRLINSFLYGVSTMQVTYFIWSGRTVQAIKNYLVTTMRNESASGFDVINMDRAYRVAKIFSITWTTIVVSGMEYWNIVPLWEHAENGTRPLPLDCWYPFDVQTSPYYELIYLYETISQTFQGVSHIGIGIFYASSALVGIRQFELLSHSLKNIIYVAMVRSGVSVEEVKKFATNFNISENFEKDESGYFVIKNKKINDMKSKETYALDTQTNKEFEDENLNFFDGKFEKEMKILITDCVQHHYEIIHFCRWFNSITSPILFIKTMYRIYFLCFVMFMAATAPNVAILDYLVMDMSELIFLTYLGTQLETASMNVRKAIYECPWYMCSTSFKKSIMLILHRVEQPVVLTAGPFFNLNLETCVKIIQASFSYYTFMSNFSPTA